MNKIALAFLFASVAGSALADMCRADELTDRCGNLNQEDALKVPYHKNVTITDGLSSWHLLTKSYGGTVSLIKGLTNDECEKAKQSALVHPLGEAPPKELEKLCEGITCARIYYPKARDIETAECFE